MINEGQGSPMQPSEVLSRAADLIRDTAAKATKNVCPDWTRQAVRHVARNCDIDCGHDAESTDFDHYGWSRYDDAPWFQIMGPAVAPALEAWLRQAAAELPVYVDAWESTPRPEGAVGRLVDQAFGPALALARTVLGEEAGQ